MEKNTHSRELLLHCCRHSDDLYYNISAPVSVAPCRRMEHALNEEELADLYAWIDQVPLSRPKRNMARDFADGGKSMAMKYC